MKIAILGAESTGKSSLANELTQALRQKGHHVHPVNEYLREWCDQHGRTPKHDEQAAIANEQARRIEAGPKDGITLADTTPLMTAIYSELLFDDLTLYEAALAQQRHFDITFITGLDVPWVADGHQRDGPHLREAFDSRLRSALGDAEIGFQILYGASITRLTKALNAIDSIANHARSTWANGHFGSQNQPDWRWPCDKCSDPDCEHTLFTRLLQR